MKFLDLFRKDEGPEETPAGMAQRIVDENAFSNEANPVTLPEEQALAVGKEIAALGHPTAIVDPEGRGSICARLEVAPLLDTYLEVVRGALWVFPSWDAVASIKNATGVMKDLTSRFDYVLVIE